MSSFFSSTLAEEADAETLADADAELTLADALSLALVLAPPHAARLSIIATDKPAAKNCFIFISESPFFLVALSYNTPPFQSIFIKKQAKITPKKSFFKQDLPKTTLCLMEKVKIIRFCLFYVLYLLDYCPNPSFFCVIIKAPTGFVGAFFALF